MPSHVSGGTTFGYKKAWQQFLNISRPKLSYHSTEWSTYSIYSFKMDYALMRMRWLDLWLMSLTRTSNCQDFLIELLMINVKFSSLHFTHINHNFFCNLLPAGSVLRMFQHVVGEEIFKDALNRLISEKWVQVRREKLLNDENCWSALRKCVQHFVD